MAAVHFEQKPQPLMCGYAQLKKIGESDADFVERFFIDAPESFIQNLRISDAKNGEVPREDYRWHRVACAACSAFALRQSGPFYAINGKFRKMMLA